MAAAGRAPRIALTLTVKMEHALLRRNVLYHHYLGVDEFYVYADDPADDTVDTVADLPFVHCRPTVPAEQYRGHPAFARYVEQYGQIASRQVLNTFDAMIAARRAGADWLVHLDTDELLCLDTEAARPGHLRERLAEFPPDVEAAVFEPLEIAQTEQAYENVFAEATLFKRPIREIKRRVPDPASGRMVSIPSYYGHVAGKSGVRLTADARPLGPHRFGRMSDETRLPAATAGSVLHYYAYSFEDFHKKFENMKAEPDVFPRGAEAPVQKRLWRGAVNDPRLSREALEDYYRRWVLLSADDLRRWRRRGTFFGLVRARPPALVEVRAVQRAWPAVEGRRVAPG